MTSLAGSDILGALVFGLLFLPILGVSEWLRRAHLAGGETTRKIVHIGGGLLSLSLPWLVRSPTVVLAMSVALCLLLSIARGHLALAGLHGVARRTNGTVYFPLAVFLVYILAYDRYWLYVCSLLVLAVADAFAALVGTAYGRLRYRVDDEIKSVEGSVVFMITAFLALHLPMLFLTDLPPAVSVLAALLVAILVTGFEAVSLGGADNLFIPLGVAVVLDKITSKPVPEIVYQNLSLLIVGGGLALMARRTRAFNVGGAIMFALFTYGAWSLGSERWVAPIIVGFLVYSVVRLMVGPRSGRTPEPTAAKIMFRVLLIPLLPLVAGNMYGLGALFFAPFATALASILFFGLWSHLLWAFGFHGLRRRWLALALALAIWAVTTLLSWLLPPTPFDFGAALVGAGVLLLVAWLDDRRLGDTPSFSGDLAWPPARLGLTALATAAVLFYGIWITTWEENYAVEVKHSQAPPG